MIPSACLNSGPSQSGIEKESPFGSSFNVKVLPRSDELAATAALSSSTAAAADSVSSSSLSSSEVKEPPRHPVRDAGRRRIKRRFLLDAGKTDELTSCCIA